MSAGVLAVVTTAVSTAPAAAASLDVGTALGLAPESALGGPVGLAVVVLGFAGMVTGLIRRRRLAVAAARKRP